MCDVKALTWHRKILLVNSSPRQCPTQGNILMDSLCEGTSLLYNGYRVTGVKSGRGVTLNPHPLLVPWTRKRRAIPLLPLWAVRPVQNLSACTRVHFTFTFFYVKETFLWIILYTYRRTNYALKLKSSVKLCVYTLFFLLNGLIERKMNEVFTVLKLKKKKGGVWEWLLCKAW